MVRKVKEVQQEYGNETMRILSEIDKVRKRPGVILGSDGVDGAAHGFFEILSNSTDEAKAGFGKEIVVTRFKDHSIQVEDFGRGIPLDYNKTAGMYNWKLAFCTLYGGGKFDDEKSGKAAYQYSLGLNGLGAAATQLSSEYFDVTSIRDGYEYSIHFDKGVPEAKLDRKGSPKLDGNGEPEGNLKKKKYEGTRTGTIQRWRPDLDVFVDIDIPLEYFQETMRRQAIVNDGIRYILHDEETGETFEYYFPDGILGYVREMDAAKGLTAPIVFHASGTGRDREDRPEYDLEVSVAFCMNNTVNALEYFHNSSFLSEGGSPDKAVRQAFVTAFDREIKARNKYTKNESKITFADIQDSLILVSNSFSTQTSYKNQTKEAISNKFIQSFISDLLKEKLGFWFVEHKEEADKAVDQVLINKRSRESSENQRTAIRKKLTGTITVANRVKKFVDCRSRDAEKRELFIVEGDSALGSVMMGRNAEFQAIMPLRGKILNCVKSDINTIFKSDVITDLIRVLGCGVEIRGKKAAKDMHDFDLANLRFGKVIVMSDQDVDGFHIRCLCISMIYRLCPKLIETGHVYIAETPLYEITISKARGKEETLFAYDEREKEQILKGRNMSKVKVQRSKGLGENTAEMMWETCLNPANRRLIRVLPEDARQMNEYFDLFMGNNLEGRKEYITKHGDEYADDLDLA